MPHEVPVLGQVGLMHIGQEAFFNFEVSAMKFARLRQETIGEKMITSAPAKITFERILIPTDFSDVSQRAIEYGKSIAARYNAQILLTHVNQPVHSAAPTSNAVQQATEQQLEQEGAELRSEGFHLRTISVTGTVREEVLSAVNREKADLIVLGTHGETGLERLLSGSDAEALLRNSPCPVFAIGPVTQAPSNLAWRPINIVCASDLSVQIQRR